ncbi:MAG: galactokinase [Bacteroidetes bacterium]|nr:galactokinase [Bacteroidota bacterium]
MIVVRTPFRLPLGGGGTDLPSYYKNHEGFLITAAVNKYMYININKPAIVDKISIKYSKVESVDVKDISLIKHEIVREAFKYLNIDCPLEVSSMADLSAGTGMGSSSSYTVGLLRALNQMKKRFISVQELAEEACKIEIDMVGKPIGKQDQYAAAFGGIIELNIDKSGNVKVTPLPLHEEIIYEMENRLMMFYTNIERDANMILAEQSSKAKANEEDVIEAMHQIKNIGYRVKESLIEGDVCSFGELLHEHWLTKKAISNKMSSSQIDDWYDLAMRNGALGGKVMGAGGGGFMLFCVGNGKRKHLRKTLEEAGLRYMDFKFDFEGVKVLANV